MGVMFGGIRQVKEKGEVPAKHNGANLALLYMMTMAFYILLFLLLGRFSLQTALIINGPVLLGFTIYFLAIARVEKEPRTRKEKEERIRRKSLKENLLSSGWK